MNPRNTWLWTAVALLLFAFIFFFERRLRPPPPGPQKILPALKAASVTGVKIQPKGQLEIRADRTNGTWHLTKPFHYPAQSEAVDYLLACLEHLTAATCITAQELMNARQTGEKYGFDPPQTALVIEQGEEQTFVHVGFRTTPGDQVFVQVVGIGEIYVVDADLLKLLPQKADDWRNLSLVDLERLSFDRLMVTNAGRAYELWRNATNRLWRMRLPGWEPRADSDKLEEALQRLQSLRVEQFVSDDPKADLDAFGLQTPALSLALEQGSNTVVLLEFGKSPTNDPGLLYARRADLDTVVTVSRDTLGPWRASYDVFRDRHLVTLTGPPDAIEIRGQDQFTLQRETNNTWQVLPQGFPADSALVSQFLEQLGDLQVAEFVKDVLTEPDLPAKGLATPSRQFILRTAVDPAAGSGLTNPVVVQLDFGTNVEDKVFARRADESSLYAVKLADLERLPSASWQVRERRIWNFTANDVARLIIQQDGRTREIVHPDTNRWSLAPGSQGMINVLAMEEVAGRLGELTAAAWVDPGNPDPAGYGFGLRPFILGVELKDGRKLSVEFGALASSGHPYARTQGAQTPSPVFEFPWALYQYVLTYLTIPEYIR